MHRKEVNVMRIKKGICILGALGSVFAIGALVIGILAFINPGESMAQGLPVNATIQFGNTGVGSGNSGKNFPRGHDESGHASDKLIPGTVSIAQGGTVTFMIVGSSRHQVEVYPAGTIPTDIDTANVEAIGGCGGPNYIDDGIGETLGPPTCAGGLNVAMKAFNEPGRYLVICRFNPHFESGMWGWVEVGNAAGNDG